MRMPIASSVLLTFEVLVRLCHNGLRGAQDDAMHAGAHSLLSFSPHERPRPNSHGLAGLRFLTTFIFVLC